MQFVAKTRYIRFSPYKLRPLVKMIRGKNARYALHWLATTSLKRTLPLQKMLKSAVANAKHLKNVEPVNLIIKDIRIDQGPSYRYFKPGAMGRSRILRKRLSHASVVLESIEKKEE
ncbi:MAG: 50S ribosomal protein L22 [Candidatus Babeliales bacterium]|jgi:large subunit ribosomal protein L22